MGWEDTIQDGGASPAAPAKRKMAWEDTVQDKPAEYSWPEKQARALSGGFERAMKRFTTDIGLYSGFPSQRAEEMKKMEAETGAKVAGSPVAGFIGGAIPEVAATVASSMIAPGLTVAKYFPKALETVSRGKFLAPAVREVPGLLGKLAHTVTREIPTAYGLGHAFSKEGEREQGGETAALLASLARPISAVGSRIAEAALPRANKAAYYMAAHRSPPDEIRATYGKGAMEPVEEAQQRAGQLMRDLGAAKPTTEGAREVVLKKTNAKLGERLDNVVTELTNRSSRVDTRAIESDLGDVVKEVFERPGTKDSVPEMARGRAAMNDLIDRFKNNYHLWWGSDFRNYVNLKRLYQAQGYIRPGDPQQYVDAMEEALQKASRVIRKHAQAAADATDPRLGAEYKALNEAITQTKPLEKGAKEVSDIMLGKAPDIPTGHGASSLARSGASDWIVNKSAPYRVRGNEILSGVAQSKVPIADPIQAMLIKALRGDQNAP